MTFEESICHKIVSPAEALKRTNALRIYGETFLVAYSPTFNLSPDYLRKLAEHKEGLNKLLILLSSQASKDQLYLGAHLQIVDFLCQTDKPTALIKALAPKKLLLEGPLPDKLATMAEHYVIL